LPLPNRWPNRGGEPCLRDLLRVLLKKNLKAWDLLLLHAEFAYNRAQSKTTNESPFKVVYRQNPLGPLDLVSLHQGEKMNIKARKRVREIQELHKRVQAQIERANERYQDQANKHRKQAGCRGSLPKESSS